jgi:HAD superfamily hydrolase (TIGR01549 family)
VTKDLQAAELDLLVIGDCNPDVLVLGDDVRPDFGQREKLVGSISLVVGGSAAITAVAAARLGLRVALVAAVGADPPGEFMLGQLATAGVDTGSVLVRPAVATGMTIALSHGSDRAIMTATGAMTALTADEVPRSLLSRARHLHVSSYFLLEQSLGPGLAELFEEAHETRTTTSLDTNWDPAEHWGGDQLRVALAHTDVLLPNEEEAMLLSGQPTFRAALPALTGVGPAVVVKLGARGAICADGQRLHWIRPPSGLAGSLVDATGAGDCFNAGLIAGLLRGMDLPTAAGLGCAVASASTRGAGGTAAVPDLTTALALADAVDIEPVPTSSTRHLGRKPSSMRAQAVCLDLDGTLLDYEGAAWADTVREVCANLQRDHTGLDRGQLFAVYTDICTTFFTELENSAPDAQVRRVPGVAIWRDLWGRALTECGQQDVAIADQAVQYYFAGRAARYRLFEDALPAIADLRKQVGALALITNGPADTQQHKIDVTGLGALVDAVVISGAAGIAKPDPAIFELAVAKLGVPLAAAWHVGDSLASDVAGARNAKLGAAVWLNRSRESPSQTAADYSRPAAGHEPHYQIASLSELAALLVS